MADHDPESVMHWDDFEQATDPLVTTRPDEEGNPCDPVSSW